MPDPHATRQSGPSTPAPDSLAGRIAQASLLRGEFTLRSGKTSTYYLDKYRFSTRPDILAELARMCAERVGAIAGGAGVTLDRLAGAELGGIPLVAAASIETGIPTLFVRNAKKDYGTAQQVEGEIEAGQKAVFLEDVATTGGQALEAVEALKTLGVEVLAVVCVIDRMEGARENIEGAGLRFEALFTKRDLGVED